MPPYVVRVATCALNQWALDFDGNLSRVITSCASARASGARFRTGPELELTGYGCEDHFFESDTTHHAWESLAQLLTGGHTAGLLVDVGLPVIHGGVRYNARAFCLDGRVVLLRPKTALADDGNYREGRWFTPWITSRGLETCTLPLAFTTATGQTSAPIGIATLTLRDATLAAESCEELFTPNSPHVALALAGVDIIANGSGSHHQLRKLHTRVDLVRGATAKGGGAYLYANQRGCDGGRVYYDGCAMAFVDGACLAQGAQFGLLDVEVLTVNIDLDATRARRAARPSAGRQAAAAPLLPTITIDFALGADDASITARPTRERDIIYSQPEEEIARGPACWLWDFLRRSRASGYFLPLSGGADSAATAAIVGVMCHMVFEAVSENENGMGDATVLADLRRIVGDLTCTWMPASPSDIASRIFHTAYMGTSNSSAATRSRAAMLAKQLGAHHVAADIDAAVGALLWVFAAFVSHGRLPRFSSRGGTHTEDLALQNLQARLRMVLAYLLAQLLPWLRGTGSGFLLVLGSANVDEALRGYLTKYDCSSADVNPIGGISKADLRRFLLYAASRYELPALLDIVLAPPTAELRPMVMTSGSATFGVAAELRSLNFQLPDDASALASLSALSPPDTTDDSTPSSPSSIPLEHTQTDEEDMGMSYAELSVFGRLRKIGLCGRLSMYRALVNGGVALDETSIDIWAALSPADVAIKVKRFFKFYAINRHKMTTLTPAYHAENYSPDDNRFDLRPFLYNTDWERQFKAIDQAARLAS